MRDLNSLTLNESSDLKFKNVELDLTDGSNGVYIVSVENQKDVVNKRFVEF